MTTSAAEKTADSSETATAQAATTEKTFAQLGIDARIATSLKSQGIVHPFAIQSLTLPVALAGQDVIGQARTGMGKTLAFAVPVLQRLASDTKPLAAGRAPRALIIVPTRELCMQVCRDITDAAGNIPLVVTAVYGGRAYEPQITALRDGVDVVVGTPGRLLDLAQQGYLQLGKINSLVLDEADEMLDLGFLPDIERVLTQVPDQRQTLLFSATMPGPIIKLARSFMHQPLHIRAETATANMTHRTTQQFVYRAHALDKLEMLARILQAEDRSLAMVFTRTKRTAAKVASELSDRGFAAAAVHGDLGQGARERALRAFRSGKVGVLVATDVAARGIDIDDVSHVINYQCPEDENTYVHRIGRTGRAGQSGVAVTFVDWDDIPRWQLINKALELDFHDPVETYSSSAHLLTDLNIPEATSGVLPRDQRQRVGLQAEKLEKVGPADKSSKRRAGKNNRSTRQRERSQQSTPRTNATSPATAPQSQPATDTPPGSSASSTRRTRRRRRITRGATGATDNAQ